MKTPLIQDVPVTITKPGIVAGVHETSCCGVSITVFPYSSGAVRLSFGYADEHGGLRYDGAHAQCAIKGDLLELADLFKELAALL